jgi:hypothetical protein
LACLRYSEECVYPSVILSFLFVSTLWSHLLYLSATHFLLPLLPAHNCYFGLSQLCFSTPKASQPFFFHDFCLFYFYGFFLGFCSKTKKKLRYLRYLSLSLSLYLSWSLVFSLFSLPLFFCICLCLCFCFCLCLCLCLCLCFYPDRRKK